MTTESAQTEIEKSCRKIMRNGKYVAVLSRNDEEFVQFCAVKLSTGTYGLMIDIPICGLSEECSERAKEFFAKHGWHGPLSLPCSFDGKSKNMTHSWGMFPDNPEDAARLGIEAFEAIHQPPPWPEYEVHCYESEILD